MAANLLPGVEYDAPNSVLRETTILFHRYNGKHANAEPWQVRVLAGPLLMPDAYAQFHRAPLSKAAIHLEVVICARGAICGVYAQSYAGKGQYHWRHRS